MFIIQDAELSHNLTLLSVLSHTMSLLTVTFTGLLASHLQRMASQCRSVVQTFLCVDVVKHYCPCSVCVCGTLASLYVCMKGNMYGRLSHWFNTRVSNHRCVEHSAETQHTWHFGNTGSQERSILICIFLALLEVFSKMKYEPKALESLVQLYKIFQLYTCHSACADFGDSWSFYTLFGIFKK